jgi:hypothetical protein
MVKQKASRCRFCFSPLMSAIALMKQHGMDQLQGAQGVQGQRPPMKNKKEQEKTLLHEARVCLSYSIYP